MDDYPELKTYLRRLGWALSSVPPRDRSDIVEETRVHVLDRIEQGRSVGDALKVLGPAEIYARSFIDEMEVAHALAAQRPAHAFAVLLGRAHRSAVAAVAVSAVIVLGIAALLGIVALIAKPLDPNHVGLWISSSAFFVGAPNPNFTGRELLGNWIYPAALLDLASAWLLGRRIVTWALNRLARRISPPI